MSELIDLINERGGFKWSEDLIKEDIYQSLEEFKKVKIEKFKTQLSFDKNKITANVTVSFSVDYDEVFFS